jgi:D-arabinose 1-dehydrogenase-like Zn-dependent alcohol dehydrogenase
VHVDTAVLVRRNVALVGVYAGGLTRAENEADHEALLELAGEGHLRAAVTTVGFDQAADAVAAVDRGAALGKVVVAID